MTESEARRGRSARYRALTMRCASVFRIWPDMARAIRRSGIRNYSIFFRGDGTFFSCFECRDPARASAYMTKQEVNTRWQKAMERFFVKRDPSILGP